MIKIAIIEARLSASRLPGKVLMPLAGRPMIQRIIDRVKGAKLLDHIVLATTIKEEDDLVEYIGRESKVNVYRGSNENVMERVMGASQSFDNSIIVQITGDNPFIEPEIIDDVIKEFTNTNIDYVCNDMPREVPLGCEIRAYNRQCIINIDQKKIGLHHLSNITSVFSESKEKYNIINVKTKKSHIGKEYRLTVDEPNDYILADKIYKEMIKVDKLFLLSDVINYLKLNTQVTKINLNVRQKDLSEG